MIKLENSNNRNIFAMGTYDLFCTGLDSVATLHTDSRKWPGERDLEICPPNIQENFGVRLISKRVVRIFAKVTPD